MRIWHYKLLSCLPYLQLISQKKDCDLIWKNVKNSKKTNDILINYIWEYDLVHLASYYYLLEEEFKNRGINFNDNCSVAYLYADLKKIPFKNHHNNKYLLECFFNLKEKFDCGQKDFDKKTYNALYNCVNKHLNNLLDNINLTIKIKE